MYENMNFELTTFFVRMFNKKKTWCVMIYLNLSTFTEFVVKCVAKANKGSISIHHSLTRLEELCRS